MKIIGAGLAGLLAAHMLRHKLPTVIERQSSLPNNHSAVLRFRSSIIGDVTGIQFRKVIVVKATLKWRNAVADALSYADKNTGMLLSDRSIPASVTTVERYIAPIDLIPQLAEIANIQLETNWPSEGRSIDDPAISTIPMPDLMAVLNYPGERPEFKSIQGSNIRAKVSHCDAYVSLYVPNPFYPFSRVSLTGDEIIAEVPHAEEADPELIYAAGGLLGIPRDRISDITVKAQRYAKIQNVDDGLRKRFIAWATDNYGVYSLGRYATWRPQLLLDDLVQDIRLIERWINGGAYAMRRHR